MTKQEQRALSDVVAHHARVECVDLCLDFARGLSPYRWHRIIYAKLAIPRLFPDRERSLYCDNDTVTVGCLADLSALAFGPHVVAGVPDAGNIRDGVNWSHRVALGLRPEDQYINVGVTLFNNEAWRREHLADRVLAWMHDNRSRLLAPEQDGINVVCAGRILPLATAFNVQGHLERISYWHRGAQKELRQALAIPRVLHYTEDSKPWEPTGYTFCWRRFAEVAQRVERHSTYRYPALRTASRCRRIVDDARELGRRVMHLAQRFAGSILRMAHLRS